MDHAEKLAREFHDTYERLAPDFGYETRQDTKAFDPTTANGKLMIAVCGELAGDVHRGRDTSALVSSTAGHVMGLQQAGFATNFKPTPEDYNNLLALAKSLAGSCLSQDETPGQSIGIHPAPAEISDAQIATDPILHFFHYAHLPPQLQATSRQFFILAATLVNTLPRNAERTVALRKLLEAKDAAVRANLPAPGFGEKQSVASERFDVAHVLGELQEIGGHDEDRDGPIPFA